MTSLYMTGKVPKDHIRIEICGILDELTSHLGMARSLTRNRKVRKMIETTQRDLYVMSAEIVTRTTFIAKLKKRLKAPCVKAIEKNIKELERGKKIKEPCFYYCGRNLTSSVLDVARTLARKAERRATTLKRKKLLKNKVILVYLNRLSDLLFLLARRYEKRPRKLKG